MWYNQSIAKKVRKYVLSKNNNFMVNISNDYKTNATIKYFHSVVSTRTDILTIGKESHVNLDSSKVLSGYVNKINLVSSKPINSAYIHNSDTINLTQPNNSKFIRVTSLTNTNYNVYINTNNGRKKIGVHPSEVNSDIQYLIPNGEIIHSIYFESVGEGDITPSVRFLSEQIVKDESAIIEVICYE